MTPDERQMLEDLATKVAQTPVPPLDKEAEELIRTRIGSRPDALYLMTQTVLIQNLALEQARKQIQQLQQNPQASAAQPSSFLAGAAGRPSSSASQQTSYAPPTYQAVPVAGPSAPMQGGGAGSFLRGAAQTAAGVAAGALAFEGISSLFHGAGHLGGFGGPSYGGGLFGGGGVEGYGGVPEETIINNYYDSAPDGRDDYATRGDDQADSQSDDSSQNDDPGQFDDTSDDGSGFGGDDGMDDSLI